MNALRLAIAAVMLVVPRRATAQDASPWTIEPVHPPGAGVIDYPALAVRGARAAVIVTPLGGGPGWLGRHESGAWSWERLGVYDLGVSRIAFDPGGRLVASLRSLSLEGGTVYAAVEDGAGLATTPRARECAIAGSASALVAAHGRTVHLYTCNRATVIEEREGEAWRTVRTLEGLGVSDAALAPDGSLHVAAHVVGTPGSEHVVIRGERVERLPIGESTHPQLEIAPDGTVMIAYDRLDRAILERDLQTVTEVVLIERTRGRSSEEVAGHGVAAALALDPRGRPVIVSATMTGTVEPSVLVRGASGWTRMPFPEDVADTTVRDAVVAEDGTLHVVYAWTGSSGRRVRYATARLPD